MKSFLDYCRLIFVSPELLIVLIVAAVTFVDPQFVIFFSKFVGSSDAAMVVGLFCVPFILIAVAYRIGNSILKNAVQQRLVKWSGYWRLEHRIYFCWIVCILNVPVTLTALYLTHQGRGLLGATLLLAGWSASGVSVASLGVAHVSLRDVIAKED